MELAVSEGHRHAVEVTGHLVEAHEVDVIVLSCWCPLGCHNSRDRPAHRLRLPCPSPSARGIIRHHLERYVQGQVGSLIYPESQTPPPFR